MQGNTNNYRVRTIPNAVAEDCVVNNLSRHKRENDTVLMQGLDLRLDIESDTPFSPGQMSDLLFIARHYAHQKMISSIPS